MAGQHGAVFIFHQAAHVRRQHFRQHRHDAIGEVNAVAAAACRTIERGAGADVEADIGDSDDGAEMARLLVIRRRPHRIVMVARVGGIDGEERQRAQILAVPQRLAGHALGLVERRFVKAVGDALGVNGDQAERFGLERIAQHFDNAAILAGRAARWLGQHQIARLAVAGIVDRQIGARLLVHRRQPPAQRFLAQDAEHKLFGFRQCLHRERQQPAALFLDPRQQPITQTKHGAAARLDHPQARRRGGVFPSVGHGNRHAIGNITDADHRHLGQAAALVQVAAGAGFQFAGLHHFLEQRLQSDLVLRVQAERLGDLALAHAGFLGGDEIQDGLPVGQAGQSPVVRVVAGGARHGLTMGVRAGRGKCAHCVQSCRGPYASPCNPWPLRPAHRRVRPTSRR